MRPSVSVRTWQFTKPGSAPKLLSSTRCSISLTPSSLIHSPITIFEYSLTFILTSRRVPPVKGAADSSRAGAQDQLPVLLILAGLLRPAPDFNDGGLVDVGIECLDPIRLISELEGGLFDLLKRDVFEPDNAGRLAALCERARDCRIHFVLLLIKPWRRAAASK